MSKGVMAPLLVTGVVVAIGQGWILSSWEAIYTMTHTGNAPAPANPNTNNAVKPIIGGGNASGLGKGGNAIPPNIIPGNQMTNPNIS